MSTAAQLSSPFLWTLPSRAIRRVDHRRPAFELPSAHLILDERRGPAPSLLRSATLSYVVCLRRSAPSCGLSTIGSAHACGTTTRSACSQRELTTHPAFAGEVAASHLCRAEPAPPSRRRNRVTPCRRVQPCARHPFAVCRVRVVRPPLAHLISTTDR